MPSESRPVLSKLFSWFRVGEIECDPRLEVAAERIESAADEWSDALREHMEVHSKQRLRRVK